MSMPADTPAAVTIFPVVTTRSLTGSAPKRVRKSRMAQWVVALRPSSSPAAPSRSEPLHTEVVHCVCSCACLIHPTRASSARTSRVPEPPGTTITSGSGSSAYEAVASSRSVPLSSATGPRSPATNVTVQPGAKASTVYGPTASSAVKRG